MNILILGGTHLMGPWAVRLLLAKGHDITLFNRGKTLSDLPEYKSIRYIFGDRRQLSHYKKKLQEISPDIVIDMLAMCQTDAEELIDVFEKSTAKRLIVISTLEVYKAHEIFFQSSKANLSYELLPLSEYSSLLRKKEFYCRHLAKSKNDINYVYDKKIVETVIQTAKINTTLLRMPFVYGPPDTSRILPYLENMLNHSPEIFIDKLKAKWCSTRGFAQNMAQAIVCAAEDQRTGKFIYNIGELQAFTEKQWIQKIAKIMNWQGNIIEKEKSALPLHLQEPFDWKQSIILETQLIRQELNYQEIISPEEGLKNTIHWASECLKNIY